MSEEPFLDTNILLRHLLGDEPTQSPRATAYVRAIEQGLRQAHLSDVVVSEAVFALERSKAEIRSAVLSLVELHGIVLAGKRKFREVFDLYVERNISFADAYHVAMMQKLGLSKIVSFDRDFNRVLTLQRVEPGSEGELV